VVGSTYETVKSFINQNVINAPADDQQLRDELKNIKIRLAGTKALVTIYTYLPMVGMTSETDPAGKVTFYEYDSLQRLKLIRDQNGKILKQYDYQYQKPVTQ
jgi:YD repeat-containing protein